MKKRKTVDTEREYKPNKVGLLLDGKIVYKYKRIEYHVEQLEKSVCFMT